ncbi:unnamed protein product, partial [Brassica oleracea var. botrytis]
EALKPRKTSKKNCTTRKQRRISSYFQSAASSSTSNDKILELLSAISEKTTKLSDQVSKLKNESKLLRKLLKRKKTPTCLKRSAFHTLLDLSKKGRQAHRGCQTEPTEPTTADLSHQTISPLSPFPYTPETSPNKSSDSLTGFVGYATAINAFSATTTSNHFSVANTIPPYIQAQPTEDSDIVELSDGSPARERPRHIPSMEENHLAKELYRCKSVPALDLISPLPQIQWDLFEKIISKHKAAFHITPSKFEFSNNFLLQLAEPTHWTTIYHMEILMHMLGARHSRLFEEQKLAFITPHLASGIHAISKSFNKSRKRETFLWDDQLTDLVLQPGRRWMEDVFTVYTPMIWADKHWVGLAINLDLGCVEILDPFPTLYSDRSVARFMAPVLKSLPYLVKKVANYQLTQFRGLQTFTFHRVSDLYINEIGGDCGPVTVKFLEMHAHGDPDPGMSSITDSKVADFRKQYALDIYKTIVMPAYYAPPRA